MLGSAFSNSGLEDVILPPTLRRLEPDTFYGCKNLKRIHLPQGLEYIGSRCFSKSGLEEFIAPLGLKQLDGEKEMTIGAFTDCKNLQFVTLNRELEVLGCDNGSRYVVGQDDWADDATLLGTLPTEHGPGILIDLYHTEFIGCNSLRVIFVEKGCQINIRDHIKKSVIVVKLPDRETFVENLRLWDLRALKSVAIPEGVEIVRNRWFAGSWIEDVKIPASVAEIGIRAFYACRHLKTVTFADDSVLEKLDEMCFAESALDKVTIPRRTMTIDRTAFRGCESLGVICVNDGCIV